MKKNILRQIEINNNIKKIKINIKICSMNISGSVIVSILGTSAFSKYNYDSRLLPLYITGMGMLSIFTASNILVMSYKEKMLDGLKYELQNEENECHKIFIKKINNN